MTTPSQFLPPSRSEYIKKQKEAFGRHAFGVFPAQYPKEILWAMNIVPIEIWDPPLEVSHANAHLQPYICSVVRLGLELILQGKCDDLDGFLFPHTCDSIQNLTSIVYDYLDLDKPCYFFYHPKAPYSEASRTYYREQLKTLVTRLEKQLGSLDLDELKRRVRQGQEIASMVKRLYDIRARGEITASNETFYQVIRQGEFLYPDDFIPLLEKFLEESKGKPENHTGVLLSGVLPNPPEMLTLLDELGVSVADDDLLGCSRRLIIPGSDKEDPFDALTDSYLGMPPCTTKDSPLSERIDYLMAKVDRSGAKGIIFNTVKFCEPELFDLPQLVQELKKQGLHTLLVDTELNQGLGGQLATRVEAFVEMLPTTRR